MKILLLAMLVLLGQAARTQAVNIVMTFTGGNPPTNGCGTGNLPDIAQANADYWMKVYPGNTNYTVHIYYCWTNDPNSGGTKTFILSQGGTPNRALTALIAIQADGVLGHNVYYLDPTPKLNEEFTNFVQTSLDLGGGYLNCSRYLAGGPTGPTGQCADLVSVFKYEMGHVLGMAVELTNFTIPASSYHIVIGPNLPFAGTVVPILTNDWGVFFPNIGDLPNGVTPLMRTAATPGYRTLPSQLDIVTLAQISGFTNVNLGMIETNSMVPSMAIASTNGYVMVLGHKKQTGMVSLSWAQPLFGTYGIQQCSNLSLGNWTSVQTTIAVTNGVYSAIVPKTGTAGFFRLKQVLQ